MLKYLFLLMLMPFYCLFANPAWSEEHSTAKPNVFSFDVRFEQQEVSTQVIDLLAPSMGRWGQLGLQIGSKMYDYPSATGVRTVTSGGDLGIVWDISDEFLPHLDFASSIAVGQSSYKSWISNELQDNNHTYIEWGWFLEYVSRNKMAMNFGTGVIVRDNLFSESHYHYGGTQTIPSQFIGAALRMGFSWF